jgi:hypothetical protein
MNKSMKKLQFVSIFSGSQVRQPGAGDPAVQRLSAFSTAGAENAMRPRHWRKEIEWDSGKGRSWFSTHQLSSKNFHYWDIWIFLEFGNVFAILILHGRNPVLSIG